MDMDISSPFPGGEVIVYESEDGEAHVDVRFDKETVWLTQRQMAGVFQSTPENILMHLRNVFSSKELEPKATTKDFLVVRTEGKRTPTSAKSATSAIDLDSTVTAIEVNNRWTQRQRVQNMHRFRPKAGERYRERKARHRART